MKQQQPQTVYCEILRGEIPKERCNPGSDRKYCSKCSYYLELRKGQSRKKKVFNIRSPIDPNTGKIKDLMFSCDGDQLDQVFGELVIKPLLADPEGIKALCNRPSKDQIKSLSEYEVSDEECLELVNTDLEYLHARFTQEKIKRWKDDQGSPDKDKASKASENLRRIASILTFKGWDKPGFPPTLVARVRYRVYTQLKEEGIKGYGSEEEKRSKLKELFGSEVIDSINVLPLKLRDLSIEITGAIFDLKPSYIEKLLKQCQGLELKGIKVYTLKSPSKR